MICIEKKSAIPAVFGLCIFEAYNPVSKAICAVSHGLNTNHVALPTSLIHKNIFGKIGYFREDLRTAEDLEWTNRYERMYGARQICSNAIVHYHEIPNSFTETYIKWRRSSLYTFHAGIQRKQTALYLIIPPIILTSILLSPIIAILFILVYIVGRGLIDPIRRSRSFWYGKDYIAIPVAILAVFVIDFAKYVGFMEGLFFHVRNKNKPLII